MKLYEVYSYLKELTVQLSQDLWAKLRTKFESPDMRAIANNDGIELLKRRVSENPYGVGIVKMGLLGFYRHIVAIDPRNMSAQAKHEFLCAVLDVSGENARSNYQLAGKLAHADSFLAMNGKAGMAGRKRFLKYFQMGKLQQFASDEIANFIETLDFISPGTLLSFEIAAAKLSQDILTVFYFDFRLPNAGLGTQLVSYYMASATRELLFPRNISFPVNYDDVPLSECLIFHLTSLKVKATEGTLNPSYFTDIISEICQNENKKIADLSDDDIQRLANHKDLRACIAGILAAHNLEEIIRQSLRKLFINDAEWSLKLSNEWRSYANQDKWFWRDDQGLPLLHAFYLECLRSTVPTERLSRYTERGIKFGDITIPPRSYIDFDIESMVRETATEKFDGRVFMPERFLTADGHLNDAYKLQEGAFLPFGVGMRQCPGISVAKMVFKLFTVKMAEVFYQQHELKACRAMQEANEFKRGWPAVNSESGLGGGGLFQGGVVEPRLSEPVGDVSLGFVR